MCVKVSTNLDKRRQILPLYSCNLICLAEHVLSALDWFVVWLAGGLVVWLIFPWLVNWLVRLVGWLAKLVDSMIDELAYLVGGVG